MEKNNIPLIPRDQVFAEAQKFNDEVFQGALAAMMSDIQAAVVEANEKAKTTGVVRFSDELIIPPALKVNDEYYIPTEVLEWAAAAGYKVVHGAGKRYFIQ